MLLSIKITRNLAFLGLDEPRILFFLLINVKMPTIVGILTFMSGKISCSAELSMKCFKTSRPALMLRYFNQFPSIKSKYGIEPVIIIIVRTR